MEKIIVTPAGRRKFLSILAGYLIRYYETDEFDEWHLWCNTDIKEDIDYIYWLEREYDFIKVIPLGSNADIQKYSHVNGIIHQGSEMIHACTISYFIPVDTIDEDAVYLRLDDDILFIKDGSIKKLFDYRLNNRENFLVYGNIVNNSAIAYIHQQIGVLPKTLGEVKFDAHDPLSLYSGGFCEASHNNFFEKYKTNSLDEYKFPPFVLTDYTRISIQVISWWGSDYKKFDGIIQQSVHEELFQSVTRPEMEGRTNVVFGDGLFCHYSAGMTVAHMHTTDILLKYQALADEYLI